MRNRETVTKYRTRDVLAVFSIQNRTYWSILTVDVLLVLVIVATGMAEAVVQRSLCGGSSSTVKEITVPLDGKEISSTFDDKQEDVNEEWLFRASDNTSFINVEFLKYELSGPDCTSSTQTG